MIIILIDSTVLIMCWTEFLMFYVFLYKTLYTEHYVDYDIFTGCLLIFQKN